MEKENIINVIHNNECCGCGACINSCPTNALKYSKNKYGFIEPKIDINKCILCGRCYQVCPSVNIEKNSLPRAKFAAMSADEGIRYLSSSGGIFFHLAKSFIRDEGIVYGCEIDDNLIVKHIRISKENEIYKLMRSKYVQSNMLDTYNAILNDLIDGKRVLFCGTPCQVSAVKNYISKEYKENLFLIDIVCHGVPSQDFFNSYLSLLKNKYGEISSYEFRTKEQIRNGMNCFFSFTNKRGKYLFNWPEDLYNYLFMMSLINRDSCYSCKYASKNRVGDITLCDYWNWEQYHYKDFKARDTVSGILVNTEKGEKMFSDISEKLKYVETELDNIAESNGYLSSSTEAPNEREKVLRYWKKNGIKSLYNAFIRKKCIKILKYKTIRKIPMHIRNLLIK